MKENHLKLRSFGKDWLKLLQRTVCLSFLFLFMGISAVFAQTNIVTGIVRDNGGEPLPGVSVSVKGTPRGTTTNVSGTYSIQVNPGEIIVFAYLGYQPTSKLIDASIKTYDLVMVEDAQMLDEVVVTGFGGTKKVNLTGAVSSVKMDETLGDRPIINASAALQGAVPGLLVTGNHEVGQAKSFQIRGAYTVGIQNEDKTWGATIKPLVLIDNVEGDMSMLNPDDIESISVLKDASSAAIYGARGAGGVIIITTKTPKTGTKFSFNYNNNFSTEHAINLPVQSSLFDYFRMYQEAGYGGGKTYWADGQDINKWTQYIRDYRANPSAFNIIGDGIYTADDKKQYYLNETDPYTKLVENSFMQTHNISASGASDKLRYRMSAGYASQDGVIFDNSDTYERMNIGAFISADITPWFTQEVDMKYASSTRVMPGNESDMLFTLRLLPYTPEGIIPADLFGLDGDYPMETSKNSIIYGGKKNTYTANPRIFTKSIFKPFKGFEAIFEYTFDKNDVRYDHYTGQYVTTSVQKSKKTIPGVDSYTKRHYFTDYSAINIYGTYSKAFGDHNFKLMGGYNQESSYYELLEAVVQEQAVLLVPSLAGADGQKLPKDSYSEYAIRGGFYRLNYDYQSKYLFEANGRYDGSSRFPKKNRFGFFPSFSAGWNIADEAFMEGVSWLDQLKLRLSWGSIGNQYIEAYKYAPSMTLSPWGPSEDNAGNNWIVNGQRINAIGLPAMVNNSFTWETAETANIGIDLALLKSRFRMSLDCYQRDTKGMLAPGFQLPSVVGSPAPYQNTADMRTKGWELALNWNDRVGDVGYRIGANLTDYSSEITNYNNVSKLLTNYYTGMKIGEIWGYQSDGYYTVDDFENTTSWKLKDGVTKIQGVTTTLRPGDIKFKNLSDADGTTNTITPGINTADDPGDRTIIGNRTPRYQFGATFGVDYKGFDLSVILQGVGKRDYWDATRTTQMYFPFNGNDMYCPVFDNQLDYWQPKDPAHGDYTAINPNAAHPRIYDIVSNSAVGSNTRASDKFITNAAYMRVKNVTLAYNFPSAVLNKIHLSGLRLFISVENLATFSKLPHGFDPETLNWTFPAYRTTSFGLSLTM